MDFLKYLQDYEKENISAVADIVENNKLKEQQIIKEAFNSEFASKKEALFNLKNYFIDSKLAPKGIDIQYVRENLHDIAEKIENMNEGDIRIIIHNHEGPGKSKDAGVQLGMEEEGAKPKRKRGRPRKNDFTVAPKNTGVIYDETEPDIEDVPSEDDVIQRIGSDKISSKAKEKKQTIVDEIKPSKLRWSDIVNKVETKDMSDKKEKLVSELAELDLNDEELKKATDMAESGEITEEDGPIGKGASIISKLKKLKEK